MHAQMSSTKFSGDESSRETERLAGELHAQLHYARIEQIFSFGLHEYLMGILQKLDNLTDEINSHFLVPVYPQRQLAVTRARQ